MSDVNSSDILRHKKSAQAESVARCALHNDECQSCHPCHRVEEDDDHQT